MLAAFEWEQSDPPPGGRVSVVVRMTHAEAAALHPAAAAREPSSLSLPTAELTFGPGKLGGSRPLRPTVLPLPPLGL
jgi:hypothetical protein